MAYRFAQEALTNVSKHAGASRVSIDLSLTRGVLSLEVSDNGRGLSDADLAKARSCGLRGLHEHVVLWDAHSICSVLPRFFEGRLTDLNLGTADGRACAPALQAAVEAQMAAQGEYSHVSNGRFKGGWITRHYGEPSRGVHALQLEMCQCTYMDETAPFAYRTDLAAKVQPLLQRMLAAVVETRP